MKRRIQWRDSAGETVSAILTGDFSPREVNADDTANRAEEIAAGVRPFFQESDLRILQLECAVTRQDTPIPKSGPNHRCHDGCLKVLTALGIDAVLLANNHVGDYGPEGVRDTLNACRNAGIRTVGAGENAAVAAALLQLNCRGLRIALLNQAEHEFGIAGENVPGCAGLDPLSLAGQIRSLKPDYDLVWVALHGGHEHYPFPSPRLRQLCRFLADSGANLVFNCHSHCPCGYEIHHGVPIVYSPGNFYFPARPTSLPCWYLGYLPKFYCDRQGAFALELIPYYNHQAGIRPLNPEETESFFQYLDRLNRPIQDSSRLERLFDAWCSVYGAGMSADLLFGLRKPESWTDCAAAPEWLGVRNLFCCESHHDLLRRTLLLMEHTRLEEARQWFPEISELQKPDWVRKK